MKKNAFIITMFMFFIAGLTLSVFMHSEVNAQEKESAGVDFEIPKGMMILLNKSCVECHDSDSDDEAAKKTLLIDDMLNMKVKKLKTALLEIASTVDGKLMPPRKFLKNNPDKALTDEEIQQLADWADDEAQRILSK